jgi:hypothetical protein
VVFMTAKSSKDGLTFRIWMLEERKSPQRAASWTIHRGDSIRGDEYKPIHS